MSQHTDDTLVRDITDAVSAILNDPAMSRIVRGAGETAPLSDEDEGALFDFVSAQPFMERFKAKYFESESEFDRTILEPSNRRHLARLCNTCLTIAMARRIAGGIYRSVDDEGVQREIARNAVPSEIRHDIVRHQDSWVSPKITFQEYYQILKEASSEPNFNHAARRAIDAMKEVGGDYHDRTVWGPARDALEHIPYKYLRRLFAKTRAVFEATVLGADHGPGGERNRHQRRRAGASVSNQVRLCWLLGDGIVSAAPSTVLVDAGVIENLFTAGMTRSMAAMARIRPITTASGRPTRS
ncbi:hypothetical protein V1277_000202 [Bradyrhizobium sp. AZCC 1588]|uniref:hypothetical protein n=1 Tax=unclassified Bradyrhizobium TaxID=2631580 RepID=UPI002FF2168F